MDLDWDVVEEYFHPNTMDKFVLIERCAVPGGWMIKNNLFEVIRTDEKIPKNWNKDEEGEWVGDLVRGTLINCQLLFYPDPHHKWRV
jgi:hypothetical protein